MQVVSDSGGGLSCKKDVPGSCSTFSKALIRSGDMRRSLEPEFCLLEMGDLSGDGIACFEGWKILYRTIRHFIKLSKWEKRLP